MTLTIGGLFEGYGGLSEGVRLVLDAELAWYSEIDSGAIRVLEHHYPGVPNLGDISQIDWDQVTPVDVLTGGFPCQDVSAAGRRAGISAGTRSGLWDHMAHAIHILRPELVVIENVRGLLSARADSTLELCPWCVGDGSNPGLRALGAVLGDLDDLGFDAEWGLLPASAVGAPHRRERIFIVAHPGRGGFQRRPVGAGLAGTQGPGVSEGLQRQRRRDTACDAGAAAAHPAIPGGRPVRAGHVPDHGGEADAGGPPQPGRRGSAAPHTARHGRGEGRPQSAVQRRDTSAGGDSGRAAADPDCGGFGRCSERDGEPDTPRQASLGADVDGRVLDWAGYQPAIERWGRVLGRPAPAPTVLGTRGGPQLSPCFTEWLMGLPEGWVTDVAGLSRVQQLKLLGNGCIPLQVACALRELLPDQLEVAA